MAGFTCPAVPPPAMTTFTGLLPLAGGASLGCGFAKRPCFAMLTRMPIAMSEMTSDEPPNETRGRGTPVIGSEAVTAPMLTRACTPIQIVIPDATQHPEPVGRSLRGAYAEVGEEREHQDDDEGADQSHLLAEDGEDEVGVRVGDVHPLLSAGPEPDAEPASRAERDQATGSSGSRC